MLPEPCDLQTFMPSLFSKSVLSRFAPTSFGEDESSLHASELEVILRAVPKRRREFTAGRRLAHGLLADLRKDSMPLVPDDDRCPVWPSGVVGSISHSSSLCAVAVSLSERYQSVGLDVEDIHPLDEPLVERICLPEEISGLDSEQSGHRGKLLFSIKEAVYKCQFPLSRVFLGFHDVKVEIEGTHFCATVLNENAAGITGKEIEGAYALHLGHVFSAARIFA